MVGAPFELSYTLTAGYISGRRAPQEIMVPLSDMTKALANREAPH